MHHFRKYVPNSSNKDSTITCIGSQNRLYWLTEKSGNLITINEKVFDSECAITAISYTYTDQDIWAVHTSQKKLYLFNSEYNEWKVFKLRLRIFDLIIHIPDIDGEPIHLSVLDKFGDIIKVRLVEGNDDEEAIVDQNEDEQGDKEDIYTNSNIELCNALMCNPVYSYPTKEEWFISDRDLKILSVVTNDLYETVHYYMDNKTSIIIMRTYKTVQYGLLLASVDCRGILRVRSVVDSMSEVDMDILHDTQPNCTPDQWEHCIYIDITNVDDHIIDVLLIWSSGRTTAYRIKLQESQAILKHSFKFDKEFNYCIEVNSEIYIYTDSLQKLVDDSLMDTNCKANIGDVSKVLAWHEQKYELPPRKRLLKNPKNAKK